MHFKVYSLFIAQNSPSLFIVCPQPASLIYSTLGLLKALNSQTFAVKLENLESSERSKSEKRAFRP